MKPNYDDDRIMHCAICGSPIQEQHAAVLLSDPAEELENIEEHYASRWGPSKFTTDLEIDEITATSDTGSLFIIQGDSRKKTACCSNRSLSRSDRYYIPTHDYCINLAKYVLQAGCSQLSSMRQLWKVLRMRCLATVASGRPEPLLKIDAPYDYLIPSWDANAELRGRWWTTNAWTIPTLTADVLARLEPSKPSHRQQQTAFRDRCQNLPQELQDHVLSFLFAERDFSLPCTYLAPQTAWVNLLLDGSIIPFLWDLDREVVQRKIAEGNRNGIEWDFELLVRRLCQSGSTKENGFLYGMPDGLQNRRRIWRLVEDMYVGDYLPEAASASSSARLPAAVPRYWDEFGYPQHPLTWIRRDSMLT